MCCVLADCSTLSCTYGSTCKVVGGVAKCECDDSTCTGESVCGSDGRTYTSECDLQKAQCTRKMTINVIKTGSCGESVIIVKTHSTVLMP